jgi:hypothetical protein
VLGTTTKSNTDKREFLHLARALGGWGKGKIRYFRRQKSSRPSEDGSAGGFKGGMPSRPSASPAARAKARSRAENFAIPFRRIFGGAREIKMIGKIFCEAGRRFGGWRRGVSSPQKRFAQRI